MIHQVMSHLPLFQFWSLFKGGDSMDPIKLFTAGLTLAVTVCLQVKKNF